MVTFRFSTRPHANVSFVIDCFSGYKIQDALSGSMHDHALTFKADL